MSDQDVFTGTDEVPVPDVKYDDLVGEGKKYKTNDDAAKALAHKDQYIKRLEQENAEAREAAASRMNEEDFLKKLEEVTRKSPEPREQPVVQRDEPEKSAVTPEDIERILETREAKRQREANLSSVTTKLQETFGDEYKSRVQSQAKALGVDTSFLTDVAAKNPTAFYKLMGLDSQTRREDTFAPPATRVTTVLPSHSGVKDYNYFRKLRQEKGEGWYFSMPVQQDIWRAQQECSKRGIPFLPE